LSQQLKNKIKNISDDQSMQEISQVLSSIGYVDPVTKETSGREYLSHLASQIDDFFDNHFKKQEVGIMTIIDAYCIYNRARGISKNTK
jgi:hypothetical protein